MINRQITIKPGGDEVVTNYYTIFSSLFIYKNTAATATASAPAPAPIFAAAPVNCGPPGLVLLGIVPFPLDDPLTCTKFAQVNRVVLLECSTKLKPPKK
jgi:hypothetical protein